MTRRRFRLASMAIAGALTLIVSLLFFTLRTDWFQAKLRSRVVKAIESATGARVTLAAIRFNPQTNSLELTDLALHGREPSQSAPLFSAPFVEAGVKFSSFFVPKVDLASIVIRRPQISVTIAPDGSTNLPPPPQSSQRDIYQQLLNLGIDRFEFDDGSLRLNQQSIRFNAKGGGLKLVWTRHATSDESDLAVISNGVVVQYGAESPASFDVKLSARLAHDRVQVSSLSLKTGASELRARGLISHLAFPDARFQLRAQLAARDVARLCGLANLSGGNALLEGSAVYAPSSGFGFNGKLRGEEVSYSTRRATMRHISVESDVRAATNAGVQLTNLLVTSPLARLKGSAAVTMDRNFSLTAAVSGANIHEIALVIGHGIPWSGVASGNLAITGRITGQQATVLTARTIASISPATGGIPVSGDIAASLSAPARISFEHSNVVLPGTQISFSGVPNSSVQLTVTSHRLDDLSPLFAMAGFQYGANAIPPLGPEAAGSFEGSIDGPLTNPVVAGKLAMERFQFMGKSWNRVDANIRFNQSGLTYDALTVDDDALHAQANGRLGLADWSIPPDSPLHLNARVQGLDVNRFSILHHGLGTGVTSGTVSAILNLNGSLQNPSGTAQVSGAHLAVYGQQIDSLQVAANLAAGSVTIQRGRVRSDLATLAFNGTYTHRPGAWDRGQLALRVDTSQFPLNRITPLYRRSPEINADIEAHGDMTMSLSAAGLRPVRADGTVFLRGVTFIGKRLGTVLVKAQTSEKEMTATLSGDLQESALRGSASVQLTSELPLKADAQFGNLDIRALCSLLGLKPELRDVLTGSMDGTVSVSGPLEDPRQWHSKLQLTTLQMKPDSAAVPGSAARLSDLVLRNAGPITIEADGGKATLRSLHITGRDTSLSAAGSFDVLGSRPANVTVNGSLNLRTLGLLDSRLDSSGESDLTAAVSGSLADPAINGSLRIRNGAFSFQDVTNGLTAVNGTILFNRDRATIQTLTAESGGGTLRLGGFVSFGRPGTLVYGLDARGEKVRVRYAGGISVTADADLRLSGSSATSLLSGTATVSRVVLNANTDIGNVFANFAAPAPAPANQRDFVSGLHFDVAIQSAANLELDTTLSRNIEADIDLHLRGTPDRPVLLGNVTANQGDIRVFGARYTINRGEVTFVDPAKIDPVLDVDLQTETRGITVDITIAGTLNKLNINYRSDPPLQPRDIIALLAVGRAPSEVTSQQSAQVSSETSQLQSGAYSALGQAISPSTSRLSKLFGVTTIKIDPLVEGIAYNTAKLTLEEQLSRNVTVTYVTNLAQTGEQVFRVEWALNPQYSVVAIRDDNGMFGLDFLFKKSFK